MVVRSSRCPSWRSLTFLLSSPLYLLFLVTSFSFVSFSFFSFLLHLVFGVLLRESCSYPSLHQFLKLPKLIRAFLMKALLLNTPSHYNCTVTPNVYVLPFEGESFPTWPFQLVAKYFCFMTSSHGMLLQRNKPHTRQVCSVAKNILWSLSKSKDRTKNCWRPTSHSFNQNDLIFDEKQKRPSTH